MSDRFEKRCGAARAALVESLEDRRLLSVLPAPASTTAVGKVQWKGRPALAHVNQYVLRVDGVGGEAGGERKRLAKVFQKNKAGISVKEDVGGRGSVFLIRPHNPRTAYAKLLNAVRKVKGFRYLEPDFVARIAGVPNDPDFGVQYGLHNTGQNGGTVDADIDGPEAWDITPGADDVVVAVLDTGVDLNHPDLAGNIWTNPLEVAGDGVDNDGNGYVDDVRGWDFANDDNVPQDDNGHGTNVAGVAAARGNNGVGIAGAAWGAKILPLKFLRGDGSGETSDAVAAIEYLTALRRRGVNVVVNNSWGQEGASQALFEAIRRGGDQGILFVAAAGNDGKNADLAGFFPAAFDLPNIISVAATDQNDGRWGQTNYGATSVDLGAPGAGVLTTAAGGGYGGNTGTSMSSPIVAGVAALALSISPAGTGFQAIKDAILQGGDAVASMTGITVTGRRVNALGTLMRLPGRVLSVTPGGGDVVAARPTAFTVVASHPLDGSSVQAGDLVVNGIAATGAAVRADGRTVVFTYAASPVAVQGAQSVVVADGAFARAADGKGVGGMSTGFRYDAVGLAVVGSSPPGGTTVAPPLTEVVLTFNEPVDPASVQAGDFQVSAGAVTGAEVLADGRVRVAIGGLAGEANLTLSMGAGAVTDVFGNGGSAFSADVVVDVSSGAIPTPLQRAEPAGSLVFEPRVGALVNAAGDVDEFTLAIEAGTRFSVVVRANEGTLAPIVEVIDAGGAVVGMRTGAAGGVAVLAELLAAGGMYRFRVGGAGGTAGAYELRVALNAGVEAEAVGGAANGSAAVAQALTAWRALPLGGAHAAVLGRTDLPVGVLPREVEPNDSTANSARLNFVPVDGVSRYQMMIRGAIGSSGDSDYFSVGRLQAGDELTVTLSGEFSERGTLTDPFVELYRWNGGMPVVVAGNDDDGPGTDSMLFRVAIAEDDTYVVRARPWSNETGQYDLSLSLTNAGAAPATGDTFILEAEPNDSLPTAEDASAKWRPVGYTSTTTGTITGAADVDRFAYELAAGDVATFAVAASAATLDAQLKLRGPGGDVLALEDGSSDGLGGSSAIYGFRAAVAGVYVLEVSPRGGSGDYEVVVHLSAQALPPAPEGGLDYYAVMLGAGEALALGVWSAAGDVAARVEDGAGNVVAAGGEFVAPAAGTYYVRVGGERERDYTLFATTESALDREENDSFAAAQGIGAGGRVVGYADDEDWYRFDAAAGDGLQVDLAALFGGAGEPQNGLSAAVELYDPSGAVVASGVGGRLQHKALVGGAYRVRITSGATTGEYVLRVTNFTAGVRGTNGNDSWSIVPSAGGHDVFLGSELAYQLPAAFDHVRFEGLGGQDAVEIHATSAIVGTTSVQAGSLRVEQGGVERIHVEMTAGDDALTLAATPTVAALTFDLGGGQDTLDVTGGVHTFEEPLGAGVALHVANGTVELGVTQQLRGIEVGPGGVLRLQRKGSLYLKTAELTIDASGRVDVADNDLILAYDGASPTGDVRQHILAGRLFTSVAEPSPGRSAALGFVDNQMIRQAMWETQPLGSGVGDYRQVIVKFTYAGDVDLDGKVTAADYSNLVANIGWAGTWFFGDVNHDGLITHADFAAVTANLGAGVDRPL